MSLESDNTTDLIHPLEKYVMWHWIVHVQTQEGQKQDEKLTHYLKYFLGFPDNSSPEYKKWYNQIHIYDHSCPPTSLPMPNHRRELYPDSAAIFAMCQFSFFEILIDWWESPQLDLLRTNDEGSSLLAIAANASSESICRYLIKKGLDVNLQLQGRYGSALAAATTSS
jgi:hypothetical protein